MTQSHQREHQGADRVPTGNNHVTLLGSVASGPWHSPGGPGKAESAAFTLAIPEAGKDGKTYTVFVRCECYGRTVAHALELRQGDMVLAEGKLSWSKGHRRGQSGTVRRGLTGAEMHQREPDDRVKLTGRSSGVLK